MSLQTTACLREFAQLAKDLWENWPDPQGSAPGRLASRQYQIRNMVNRVTRGFMTPPEVEFAALGAGTNGSFGWTRWRLRVNSSKLVDGLTYKQFATLMRTVYHESRHSEQFFRIAQGLCHGRLTLPQSDRVGQINSFAAAVAPGSLSVAQRVALFQGQTAQVNRGAEVKRISNALNIPMAIVQAADTTRAQYDQFTQLAVPDWFKRSTMQLEVEDWMRETYSRSLSELAEWTQSDDGPYQMYRDQPTENDAHGIGDVIKAEVIRKIGRHYNLNKDKQRTDPAFG